MVADEDTFGQLLEKSHVIWLQASPAEHMRRVMEQGDFRPMEHNRDAMKDLVAILDARAPLTTGARTRGRYVGEGYQARPSQTGADHKQVCWGGWEGGRGGGSRWGRGGGRAHTQTPR